MQLANQKSHDLAALIPDAGLVVQRLSECDTPALIAHFQSLSELDRYMRFFSAVSDDGIESIVNRFDWTRTLAVGAFKGINLIGVAEMGWEAEKSPTRAEIAMSVDRNFRRLGIATWLLDEVCKLGRQHSVREVYASWMGGNDAVCRIMRNMGAETWLDGTVWTGEGRLDPAR